MNRREKAPIAPLTYGWLRGGEAGDDPGSGTAGLGWSRQQARGPGAGRQSSSVVTSRAGAWAEETGAGAGRSNTRTSASWSIPDTSPVTSAR